MGYDLRSMNASTGPSTDPVLTGLREQIAAADRDIVAAFARRLHVAAEIKSYKHSRGYDFVDPEREKQLLGEWRLANDGAVSDETLLELFATVLRLSKRETGR